MKLKDLNFRGSNGAGFEEGGKGDDCSGIARRILEMADSSGH